MTRPEDEPIDPADARVEPTGQSDSPATDPAGTGQSDSPATDPAGTGQSDPPATDPAGTGQSDPLATDPAGREPVGNDQREPLTAEPAAPEPAGTEEAEPLTAEPAGSAEQPSDAGDPDEVSGGESHPEAPEDEEEPLEPRRGKKMLAFSLAAMLLLAAVFGSQFFLRQGENRGDEQVTGSWSKLPFPPIDPRYGHSAVWTGSKMIVWGGFSGVAAESRVSGAGIRADGAELDPQTGNWEIVPPAPLTHRPDMAAVWTGKEMIAWGGDPAQPASGIAYDPAAKAWRSLPQAPLGLRGGQSVLWTGTEVLLWGGRVAPAENPAGQPNLSSSGAAFNPATGAWREIPPAPVGPRDLHSAVWTGKEMIVWGGTGPAGTLMSADLSDGAAFDPSSGTWRAIAKPPVTIEGTAVWSGKEMFVSGLPVVGGTAQSSSGDPALQLIAYDPLADRWRNLPPGPLSLRTGSAALWSGNRLVVWGGFLRPGSREGVVGPAADGATYDPQSNTWQRIAEAPIKGRDSGFSMVAAGDEVIIWGGKASERGGPGTTLADGARLTFSAS